MDMNLSKLQEIVEDGEPGMLQSVGLQRVGHNLVTEKQQQINEYSTIILVLQIMKLGAREIK